MAKELEAATTKGGITLEQLHECVGIENFVTRGLAKQVVERRRALIRAVLLEQNLQRQRGITDNEMLRTMSRHKSEWSRDRARKLAEGYSEFLNS